MRLRIWGFPVPRISGGLPDPIQPLDDPDETPEPPSAPPPDREAVRERVDAETVRRLHEGLQAWNPDGPNVAGVVADEPAPEVVTERLQVEPELRPWDTAGSPPRQPVPDPPALAMPPHCDGLHGPDADEHGRACAWCDALTSWLTAHRALERRITALEERVKELVEQADQRDEYEREMRERES